MRHLIASNALLTSPDPPLKIAAAEKSGFILVVSQRPAATLCWDAAVTAQLVCSPGPLRRRSFFTRYTKRVHLCCSD
jgi:hypothetical protein